MDPQIPVQIAGQIEAYMEGIKAILWFVSLVNVIFLGLLSLFGYWIWDLNKKIATAVTGADCELRNNHHYEDTEKLRLEVKGDIEKHGLQVDKDLKEMTDRFAYGMKRLSKESESAIKSLKAIFVEHNKALSAQNQINVDQHQKNFEALVGVLKDIGTKA